MSFADVKDYKKGLPYQWKSGTEVTAQTGNTIDPPLDGFIVTTAGVMEVHFAGDAAGSFVSFPVLAGVQYSMCIDEVGDGTTADGIVGGRFA
jgi:hypothetical protein